ncbi:MAG: GntR family transcriptional regulator [Actinomycetota bacterium]|nr:GntR family transcriptional regulator [Actinomycetota bacterium]
MDDVTVEAARTEDAKPVRSGRPRVRSAAAVSPPSVPQPLQRAAPLRQAVYEALADLIVKRALRPGQHLVESELAGQLGVSRQPVREALQRLQTEGWVDLKPAQGAFVHTPTDREADDLLTVRTLLETEAARLAARTATDADVKRLWELQAAGEAALSANDQDRLVVANAELHSCVVALSGNGVLCELSSMVDRRVRWYYTPIARSRGLEAWDEHAALIRAIASRDEDEAAVVMRRHTERTRAVYHARLEAAGAAVADAPAC